MIEFIGGMIFEDAAGWQPFQEAFNLMPYAGGVFMFFGIVNIASNHVVGGIVQFVIGCSLVVGGMLR